MSEIFKKIKNVKGIGVIALILTVIVALLLFSGNLFGSTNKSSAQSENENFNAAGLDAYARSLEGRIKSLITPISGVGAASVMVYLDCSEEYVYSGGSNSKEPTKIISPRVSGVAVVCTGGNDPAVKAKVTTLISSLFNIGSQHVSVTGN